MRATALAGAAARLDACGVPWCLLRDPPEDHVRDDVDILVAADAAPLARAALEAGGFARLFSCGRGSHSFFVRWDAEAGAWLQLDLVSDLSFGPLFALATPLADACLGRRVVERGLARLDTEDEFWLVLLHCLLDKNSFSEKHRARLESLAGSVVGAGPAAEIVAADVPRDWSLARIITCAATADWDRLLELRRPLIRRWFVRQPLGASTRFARATCGRIVERFVVPLRRPGVALALVGVDGAGKSTVVERIRRSYPLPIKLLYMGLWAGDDEIGALRRLSRIPVRPLKVWAYWATGLAFRVVGRTVIFDRYAIDAQLPPRPPFVGLKRAYLWLVAHACPGPHEIVVLDVPGELAAGRKNGHRPETLEEDRQAFLALQARIPNLVVVDASQPVDEVEAEVNELLWRRAFVRQLQPV